MGCVCRRMVWCKLVRAISSVTYSVTFDLVKRILDRTGEDKWNEKVVASCKCEHTKLLLMFIQCQKATQKPKYIIFHVVVPSDHNFCFFFYQCCARCFIDSNSSSNFLAFNVSLSRHCGLWACDIVCCERTKGHSGSADTTTNKHAL